MSEKTKSYVLKYGNHWMREKGGMRKYNAGETVVLTDKQAKAIKDKIDWALSIAKSSEKKETAKSDKKEAKTDDKKAEKTPEKELEKTEK